MNHLQAPGFSSSGPQVDLWAPSTDDSCDDGGMFFRRSENRIHVCSDSDRSPEDVAHEFGHWTHWNLYGQSFWPSPGGPHNLCDDGQNRGLSWTEGFGNFFAPRVGLEVIAPSADNNGNYDRPWDGSGFSLDMETNFCQDASNNPITGDDNEMQVAFSLWDLRDAAVDGVDTGSATGPSIAGVISACDDDNFRDFFDGGGCNWVSQGGSGCTLMRAAWQNNIDFDDTTPTVEVTSQGAFAWVRGTIGLTASATDPDQGCVPDVEFRVSGDATCTATDTLVGTDTTSPYSRSFDTTTVGDNADYWACAKSSDGLQPSAWDASASHVGVDNTPPSVGMSGAGTPGNNGWWRSAVTVTLGCTDNLSGVAGITYALDGGPTTPYGGAFVIAGEGVHSLSFTCADNAGNTDSDAETVRIDTRDPATTAALAGPAGENGSYVGDVTVTLACTDPVPGSGCFSTQVAHDAPGAGGPTVFDYASPFTLTGDGVHAVDYHSADVAGNVEATQSIDVAIDTVPPAGEIVTVADGTFTYTGAYAAGGIFTNAPTVAVEYHATDAASGLQLVSIVGGDSDAYTGELDVTGTLTVALPDGISTWTVLAEDMAGHVAEIGTFTVVMVPPDTFPDNPEPRVAGWWKNAMQTGQYTETEVDAMLPLANTGSHALGTPDARWDVVTLANYGTYLHGSQPDADARARKELTAAWLNLVSGRELAAQPVDLSSGPAWTSVVTNTGGSQSTTALNVVLQAEQRLREAPSDTLLNQIKAVLAALNSGAMND